MQVTVILAILIAMLIGHSVDLKQAMPFTWQEVASGSVGLLIIGWAMFHWASVRLIRRLQRIEDAGGSPGRLPGRVELAMRGLSLGVFTLVLWYGGWAEVVLRYVRVPGVELMTVTAAGLIVPFLILDCMRLWCFYRINRHIREHVVFGQLSMGLSARPVWSLGQYMSFNIRHGLLILLVPILCILALQDVIGVFGPGLYRAVTGREIDAGYEIVSHVGALAAALIVFVFVPLLLRRVWQTRSLPDGPLRRKLSEFCEFLRLRRRDILLWETYSAVANAAVMGVWGKVRYVLLSDSLIENTPDEQIEAVFGHEAGHVYYRHIPFLVLFVAASSLVFGVVMELAMGGLEAAAQRWAWAEVFGDAAVMVLGLTFGVAWLLLFGWVSRHFERQADVYGAMATGAFAQHRTSDDGEQAGHLQIGQYGRRLNEYGAAVMGASLHRIAMLNGISIESRSWRHSSIGSRMMFLRGLAEHDGAIGRFMQRVFRIKVGIVLALIFGAAAVWLMSAYG